MGKKSIREIRRTELSQAAFEALVTHGLRGATLDRVAARAGVSKGVVLHHFRDKDALFEAVQRRTNTLLRDTVARLLRLADGPQERLCAVIVGNFAAPAFHQEVCHAWINLCADVPQNRQSQRIQTAVHARMRSNLLSALRGMYPAQDAEAFAFQITTFIDGVWLRASMQQAPMTSREGIDYVNHAVVRLLGFDRAATRRHQRATQKMEALAASISTSPPLDDHARGFR